MGWGGAVLSGGVWAEHNLCSARESAHRREELRNERDMDEVMEPVSLQLGRYYQPQQPPVQTWNPKETACFTWGRAQCLLQEAVIYGVCYPHNRKPCQMLKVLEYTSPPNQTKHTPNMEEPSSHCLSCQSRGSEI